jgi:hypothetical protein
MKKYYVYYGINWAGMGADTNQPILVEGYNQHEAEMEAYRLAWEDYESYAGSHGIESREEFDDDDEYHDHVENSIDYYAKEWTPELEQEIKNNWG